MEKPTSSISGGRLALSALLFSIFIALIFLAISDYERHVASKKKVVDEPVSAVVVRSNLEQEHEEKPVVVKEISYWRSFTSVDEMTGEVSSYAVSESVYPNKIMDSPYGNVTSWLAMGCKNRKVWAYIGFSEILNLTNGKISYGGSGKDIPVRIRWDDDVESIELWQSFNSTTLFFSNDEQVVRRMKSASSMKLELQWYGNGAVYFQYPLKGSSKAISEALSECGR